MYVCHFSFQSSKFLHIHSTTAISNMFFIFVAGLLGGILLSAVILHKLDRKSLKEKHVLISGKDVIE